ncbi:hypothetical protein CIHG_03244 [Coccidioides immitis H538.4]|uniref:Uncharacterized protein n=1 Tax=Coccidioides immitis H538.4 TaxID=396776 RepID=A0A0J8RKW0_COCIT|nr:hypothetical protein CIHG_03244 [Coccidioides immitis H538.4]
MMPHWKLLKFLLKPKKAIMCRIQELRSRENLDFKGLIRFTMNREVEQTERGDAAHPFEEAKPKKGKKGKKDKKPESVSWEAGELPTEIPPANAETSQQALAVDVAEGESTGKEPEFEEPKSTKSKRKAKKEKRKQRDY